MKQCENLRRRRNMRTAFNLMLVLFSGLALVFELSCRDEEDNYESCRAFCLLVIPPDLSPQDRNLQTNVCGARLSVCTGQI